MNHLKTIRPNRLVAANRARRGYVGQRVKRERITRRHVVGVGRRLVEQGWKWNETAERLGIVPRTLRDWRRKFASYKLQAVPLGRPVLAATREQRNEVIRHIDELGPAIGLPSLRLSFPELARAELHNILGRYRRVWRRLNQRPLHVLHWTRPGTVWAIDFHGPRPWIDGLHPYLLAVRDLSSGNQLLWLPVADECADTVVEALALLFAVHGVPLVLKSDNGSAFIAEAVRKLCRESGVKHLFSPPRMPSYNGSIEAGIGSLTSRTEQHAARRGQPGNWTWDDVGAARLEANDTARPRGEVGPSSDRLWAERTPITDAERTRFTTTVDARLREIEPAEQHKDDMQRRAMEREVISQALVEHGYLYFTRRRIPLPIRGQKAASIL